MKKLLTVALVLALSLSSVLALADTQLIGVPDDATNLARALKLLEVAGLIELDPAAGNAPEIKDVTKYLYDIEIAPTTANTLTSTLDDYVASTINGTYAVPYGLVPSKDALIIEEPSAGGESVNIIVARTADKDNETYKKIVDAFQTQLVAEFLLENYKETFYPAFDYNPDYTVEEGFTDALNAYESDPAGKQVVKVGVCGANNNQWFVVQKILDDENAGIYIELVEFDAYNLPNEALNNGDIDLNSFQHKAFLQKEINANGYELTAIGDTLVAPLGLYSKKVDSIDALKALAGALAE